MKLIVEEEGDEKINNAHGPAGKLFIGPVI